MAWPAIRLAYGWIHKVAHILANHELRDGRRVRRQLSGLLGSIKRHQAKCGELAKDIDHFLRVTRSYWPGLFACYEVPDLPRTNNALEQFFGSHRYHERRATGRKAASPSLVLRGSVRLIAAAATRLRPYSAVELSRCDRTALTTLRKELSVRRERRVQRYRFRRNPDEYLRELEQRVLKQALPS